MKTRDPKKRIGVDVEGHGGSITAEQVERYLLDRGWMPVFAHEEPAEAAPWYHARPRRFWQERWPLELPIGYDREGASLTLPSPYYLRVPLVRIIKMLAKVERGAPHEVFDSIRLLASILSPRPPGSEDPATLRSGETISPQAPLPPLPPVIDASRGPVVTRTYQIVGTVQIIPAK